MPSLAEKPRVLRFGAFECDPLASELRKSGMRVRLPEQPLRVLLALLERPGSVVTREELRQRLWSGDTFVDFDHGLNAAVKRLRTALGDDASSPRFVETVPMRGYRFVARVEEASCKRTAQRLKVGAGLTLGLVAAGAVGVLMFGSASTVRAPELTESVRITFAGRVAVKTVTGGLAPVLTDGVRLYFTEMDPGGRTQVAHVPVAGGDAVSIPSPLQRPLLLALAPDGARLLVRDLGGGLAEGPLFILPTAGGGAQRLGTVIAQDGAWSHDGQRLVLARGSAVYCAGPDGPDGSNPRRLATLPGLAVWPRWSPNDRVLRLTVIDPRYYTRSLWELAADGSSRRPLQGARGDVRDACCGEWTPQGDWFVFLAYGGGATDLWGLREGGLRLGESRPVRLTRGPLGFSSALPSRDGRRLFAARSDARSEFLRYDVRTRRLVAHRGIAGEGSPGQEWIVWADKAARGGLWRSRPDGRDRLQLAPATVALLQAPRWSPDGTRVAFAGRESGKPWKIHVVSADGGDLRRVLPGEDHNEADPSWSPDARSLMFGRPPDYLAEPGTPKAIQIVDLETNRVSTLPGSQGLFSPRWSPDGTHVAAMPLNQRGLMLFDFATGKWARVAPNAIHNPLWSRDGRSLYFQEREEEYRPIYRVALPGLRVEKVVSAAELARDCDLVGLSLDDAPYLRCQSGGADLYALEWNPSPRPTLFKM